MIGADARIVPSAGRGRLSVWPDIVPGRRRRRSMGREGEEKGGAEEAARAAIGIGVGWLARLGVKPEVEEVGEKGEPEPKSRKPKGRSRKT